MTDLTLPASVGRALAKVWTLLAAAWFALAINWWSSGNTDQAVFTAAVGVGCWLLSERTRERPCES